MPLRAQGKADILAHAVVRIEAVALEHHGDAARAGRNVVDEIAADHEVAAGLLLEPADDAQERRLAAAGRSQQHHELAVRHRERDAVDGRHLAEFLDDIPGQNRSHRTSRKFQNRHTPPPPARTKRHSCPPLDARNATALRASASCSCLRRLELARTAQGMRGPGAGHQDFCSHFSKMASHCCVAHLTESSALIAPVAALAIMSRDDEVVVDFIGRGPGRSRIAGGGGPLVRVLQHGELVVRRRGRIVGQDAASASERGWQRSACCIRSSP